MPRRLPKRLDVRRAVMVLHSRVAKLERFQKRIEGKRRIGFDVSAQGDRIEQDDPEFDYTPDEVRR